MPDQYERCGNCGDVPVVARCIDAFGGPHTHPRSIHDLTDEYCTHRVCARCERTIRSNVTEANREASRKMAEAALADPEQRARLERMMQDTANRVPVPDDFKWLEA